MNRRPDPKPRKQSVTIAGHPTSISLEPEFRDALAEIANERSQPVSRLIGEIDEGREGTGLSSAIRLYVLDYFRRKAGGAGQGD